MTFKEKRLSEYSGINEQKMIEHLCPCDLNYEARDSGPCIDNYTEDMTDEEEEKQCRDCWNREIPGTEVEQMELEETYSLEEVKEMCDVTDADIKEALKTSRKVILDSGERREFETGAVRDIQEGKGRMDLTPINIIGAILEDGILMDISMFQSTDDTMYLAEAIKNFGGNYYDDLCTMFLEVGKHFEEGARKYSENNWKKGIPTHCYIDSAVRHYLKFLRGDQDEYHDRAFVWNLMCCIWTVMNKPEIDDYRKDDKNGNNNH